MTDLIERLRGEYAMGPHLPNGSPEFGFRQFETTSICKEAVAEIERQAARIAELETKMIGVMAALAAAVSLLERSPKTAAPSDKMFDQMLEDYTRALATARTALNPGDPK